MAVSLKRIDNPQEIEVVVSGPRSANRLFIYTGTAVFDFKGRSKKWKRDSISFRVGRKFAPGQFHKAIATANIASASNDYAANFAGWAVDSIDADWDDDSGKMNVTAQLAVRDSDGYLHRLGYQVTVLASI